MPLKNYSSDIVHGLVCKRKIGVHGPYLVFSADLRIKWWIVPSFGQYKLFHAHWGGKKHSQGKRGKPHELITYIARHEAYELRLIPPFSNKHFELDKLNKMLKAWDDSVTEYFNAQKYMITEGLEGL